MRHSTLFAAVVGGLSLGISTPSILAQTGYGHRAPYPGIYDDYPPAYAPYLGNSGGPYPPAGYQPGRYDSYPPPAVDPYRGGYATTYRRGYGPDPGAYEPYPSPPVGGYPALRPGPSPVIALTEQLVGQADAFLQAFATNAQNVPEGGRILADARALRDAAARFHQVAAGGGYPAAEFQAVEASWQRLESRMGRIAKGRIGPNIATAIQMGQMIAQIRSML